MSTQGRLQDKIIICVDCRAQFEWSAEEQEYFHKKGFTDPPKRCKACRQAKKARLAGYEKRQGSMK